MTTEEFNAIKWRPKGILLIGTYSCLLSECEHNGITITMQVYNQVLKCGGCGKPKVAYLVGQREFRSEKQLIKYLNEYESKDRN